MRWTAQFRKFVPVLEVTSISMDPPTAARNAVFATTNLLSNCEPDNCAAARCDRWIWTKFFVRFCEVATADRPGLCTGSALAASQGGGVNSGTLEILLVQKVRMSFCCVRRHCCHWFGGENAHSILPVNCCEIIKPKNATSSSDQFTFCCRGKRRLRRVSCVVDEIILRRRQLHLFQQLMEQTAAGRAQQTAERQLCLLQLLTEQLPLDLPSNLRRWYLRLIQQLKEQTSAGRAQRFRRGSCANRLPTAHGAVPAGGAQQFRRFSFAERQLRQKVFICSWSCFRWRCPAITRQMRLDVPGHSTTNFYRTFPVSAESTFLQKLKEWIRLDVPGQPALTCRRTA